MLTFRGGFVVTLPAPKYCMNMRKKKVTPVITLREKKICEIAGPQRMKSEIAGDYRTCVQKASPPSLTCIAQGFPRWRRVRSTLACRRRPPASAARCTSPRATWWS